MEIKRYDNNSNINDLISSSGANVKIVFRHSTRPSLRGVANTSTIGLTEEGVLKAREYGNTIQYPIGVADCSPCKRCVDTIYEILHAKSQNLTKVITTNKLKDLYIYDYTVAAHTYRLAGNLKQIAFQMHNNIYLPGFYDIETCAKKLFSYIFSRGNSINEVDLFCTHDFIIVIAVLFLFDFNNSINNIVDNWPDPLEGIVIIGQKGDFKCFWRNKCAHCIGLL